MKQITPKGKTSWVVLDRVTGKPIMETWNLSVTAKLNPDKVKVITTKEWSETHGK